MVKLREKSKSVIGKLVLSFRRKLTLNTLFVLIISLALFVFAIYFKNIIGVWIYNEVGFNYSYTFVNADGVSSLWHFETYLDSQIYYELFTISFIFDGWNPYIRSSGLLDNYLYGPIFLYGEVIFYFLAYLFLPGSTRENIAHEGIKWNALVFDALSVVMLYILITNLNAFRKRRVTKHVVGLLGGIGFAFIPINLFYIDAYFLNIPQMTFFTLLTFHQFMNEKYILSSISLSIAWLTKQIPLFFLIPMFFMLIRKKNIRFALKKFLIPHVLTCFVLSIPWLFITPLLYVGRIIGAGRPLWYISLEHEAWGHGTSLAHSFYYLNCQTFSQILLYLNIAMIPFLAVFFMGTLMSHFNGEEILSDEFNFYIYMNWFVIILHTFLSRGVFKYYDAFLNPFMILSALLVINKVISLIGNESKKSNDTKSSLKDNYKTNSKIGKSKYDNLLYAVVLIVSFVLSIACLYSIDWWLMIIIRYMHPLLLLGLTIVASFMIPLPFYKSLFEKNNYKKFGSDIKQTFVICFRKIDEIFEKVVKKRKKREIT